MPYSLPVLSCYPKVHRISLKWNCPVHCQCHFSGNDTETSCGRKVGWQQNLDFVFGGGIPSDPLPGVSVKMFFHLWSWRTLSTGTAMIPKTGIRFCNKLNGGGGGYCNAAMVVEVENRQGEGLLQERFLKFPTCLSKTLSRQWSSTSFSK